MTSVSIEDASNRLAELARRVESGETIVVTRDGQPVLDLAPHRGGKGPRGGKGLNLAAIDEFKAKYGVETIVTYISEDFDDPLPEDFLLRPLPSDV